MLIFIPLIHYNHLYCMSPYPLGVSDAVRPEAAHVVRSLHNQGIACYMITGDEATTAHVGVFANILILQYCVILWIFFQLCECERERCSCLLFSFHYSYVCTLCNFTLVVGHSPSCGYSSTPNFSPRQARRQEKLHRISAGRAQVRKLNGVLVFRVLTIHIII